MNVFRIKSKKPQMSEWSWQSATKMVKDEGYTAAQIGEALGEGSGKGFDGSLVICGLYCEFEGALEACDFIDEDVRVEFYNARFVEIAAILNNDPEKEGEERTEERRLEDLRALYGRWAA